MNAKNQRVVLVTGASSGIGSACARHLAGRGYRVYGTSRLGGSLEGVTMLAMDVTVDASVEEAVSAVLAKEGRLDVLVNNAGMGVAGPLEATPVEAAKRQFDVNFFGVLRLCRAVLPAMQQAACRLHPQHRVDRRPARPTVPVDVTARRSSHWRG